MVELNKPSALNLGTKPDANVEPKPDNADQVTTAGPDNAGPGPQALTPETDNNPPVVPPEENATPSELQWDPSLDTQQTTNLRGERVDIAQVVDEGAAQRAVDAGGVQGAPDTGETLYSSHPIQRLAIGRFESTDTVFRIPADDVEEFEALLEGLPMVDRLRIRKLDISRVDAIVAARRDATKQFDSSVGREALQRLHAETPTVGIEDIAHAARPQSDQNVPQVPTQPVDPEGETGVDQGSHSDPAAGTNQATPGLA